MVALEGKVALVTGGSSGIGRAVCLRYASEGAAVVLSSRRVEEGEQTAEMVRAAGGEATFVQGDITRTADVLNMVKTCLSKYGALDIACNNAGIEGPMQLMSEISEDEFSKVIDVNLLGTWRSMKAELQPMIAQGGGVIVNVGSIAGIIGFPNAAVYSASKHAMIGLTKTAAQENAPHNVRVNIVCPGLIDTEMANRFTGGETSEVENFIIALTQIRRRGTSEEIADAVLYLSSDQSSYVTGHSLVIDGGATTI